MILGEDQGPADDGDDCQGAVNGPAMPVASPPSKRNFNCGRINGSGGNSTPRKSNGTKKSSTKSEEPNVEESTNKLPDGINRATNALLPDPNLPPPPPTMMPDRNTNMDSAQLENISEEMMNSNVLLDAVVNGVMKQLLDKKLMYGSMKEVCRRFTTGIAADKENLF